MAWSLVVADKASHANHPTLSGVDTTGCDLIIVAIGSGQGTPTVSDNKGNTWTALTVRGPTNEKLSTFYCVNPIVGTGHNFTESSVANTFSTIAIAGFSGVGASPFDQHNGSSGTTIANQPGSITPTENNELIVACLSTRSTGTRSINSGFTIAVEAPFLSGQWIGVAIAYLIQTTAAAVNPTWDDSGGVNIFSFKGASAPPPTQQGRMLLVF